ncbi:MAG TPA: hypothetical protein VNW97_20970 [Candidatus Saccharimonadales bacterium]|jgi:hypothetical protein|nr:hypothetical protein [Candidatus Saccharimonadales bacterium]
MLKQFMLIIPLLLALSTLHSRAQSKGLPVEVVATATEYIAPASQGPTAKPERSYTDCTGHTSYLGDFANTKISCSTTSIEERAGTAHLAQGVTNAIGGGVLTGRPKIRYTVVVSDSALYLFSCEERWRWSKCPRFAVGGRYLLTLSNADASLQDSAEGKALTLQYHSSVALPKPAPPAVQTPTAVQPQVPKGITLDAEQAISAPPPRVSTTTPTLSGALDSVMLGSAFTNAHGVVLITMESTSEIPEKKKSSYDLSCNQGEESCRIPWKNVVYTLRDAGRAAYACQNVSLYQGDRFYGIYCLDGLK